MRATASAALILLAPSTLLVLAQSSSSSSTSSSVATSGLPSVVANGTATASGAIPTTSSTGVNPLIPTTVTTSCANFLEHLNADSSISACATPLRSALEVFAPSSASTYTASEAQVNETLNELCSTAPCSDSLLRKSLTYFHGNCSSDLTAGVDVVVDTYDALYALGPFLSAICTKDVKGDYCLSDIVAGKVPAQSAANATSVAQASASALGNSSSLDNSTITADVNTTRVVNAKSSFSITDYVGDASHPVMLFWSATSATARRLLFRRQFSNTTSSGAAAAATTTSSANTALPTTGVVVNTTTFAESALPFLLLSSNMSSSVLCTPCTKSILAPYVSFEARSPYALGLANSRLLGQQGQLWQGIADVCGSGFVASIATLAGETSAGLTGAAAQGRVDVARTSVGVGALAVVGLVAFLL
ncbi:hypothetical protein T439DRAFT_322208 [Meredithblackwellia eburnea MCA 4105]